MSEASIRRRGELMRGLVSLLLVPALGGCTGSSSSVDLEGALAAARWIQSVGRPAEDGKVWPADPDKPEEVVNHLYSGNAGVVLFFLELYHATGDEAYLDEARDGADHLLAMLTEDLSTFGSGLYTGIAGSGLALLETYRAAGDERYRVGVLECVSLLVQSATAVGDGVEWSEVTDIISGSAGVGLFLLRVDQELGSEPARKLAVAAGHRLIEQAIETDTGLKWQMAASYPRLMPNFSHGTAGVAFFLASLYRVTDEPVFLEQSVAGARYLLSIADTANQGCLIFHHEPEGEDLFYLGWCHGPVGTARLFYTLGQLTEDPEWHSWVRRSAHSIMTSGIPEQQTPGFWNNQGQCCGSAGVAQFFLSLHQVYGETAYLDFSRRVTDDLLKKASATPQGLKWIQAEHRRQPDLLVAQTGYMQGAAGIGMLLLRWHAAGKGLSPQIVFPDDPFG